jgi:hypothetical protein
MAQVFDPLLLAPNAEVAKSALPEAVVPPASGLPAGSVTVLVLPE